MSKERFKIIPAVYLFLERDNKILLLRRFNTGYEDGNYSVVAGHLDGDEPCTKAMIREAKEEAGITLRRDNMEVVHIMHRKTLNEVNERMDIFLKASVWDGEIKIMEPNKCDELKWFSFGELPENIIPYTLSAILNIKKGKFFSEFGWE